jgi:hypothetical protein
VNDTPTNPTPARQRRPRVWGAEGKLTALMLALAIANHLLVLAPVHAGAGTVPWGARAAGVWVAHNAVAWSRLSRCLAVSLLPTGRHRAACWHTQRRAEAAGTAPGPGEVSR